jgi:hypothetical protein
VYLTCDVTACRSGREAAVAGKQQTDDYVRQAAGRSPAEEIAHAKELLDGGTITPSEYESLKAKALA